MLHVSGLSEDVSGENLLVKITDQKVLTQARIVI